MRSPEYTFVGSSFQDFHDFATNSHTVNWRIFKRAGRVQHWVVDDVGVDEVVVVGAGGVDDVAMCIDCSIIGG